MHSSGLTGPGFRNFISLESITIGCDPMTARLLFLREMAAPPNLMSLHLHDKDHGLLEVSVVGQTSGWSDTSKGLYLLPAVLKELKHLTITSEQSSAYDISVNTMTKVGAFMRKEKIEFRWYRKRTRVRIVRPILYGETEDDDILVYKNDGRALIDAGGGGGGGEEEEELETETESSWVDETDEEDDNWDEESGNEELGSE